MRRPCLALAALALTACSPGEQREALEDSRSPPSLAERHQAPEGWAWGRLAPPEGPQVRYGVAAPAGQAARGDILILPAYGEPAEVWFETARDLLGQGWRVWSLERAGQGGAGRFLQPYDLGHSRGFAADAEAVRAMVGQVIRPAGDDVVLLGAGDGAVVALLAVQSGAGVDRLILSAPALTPLADAQPWESMLGRIGLGRLPSLAWRPWSRSDPPGEPALSADPHRRALGHQWEIANPDLRLTGPSLGWRAAFQRGRSDALSAPGAVATPVLILSPAPAGAEAQAFCRRAPACEITTLSGSGEAPHLEQESIRSLWFERLSSFLAEPGAEVGSMPAEPAPHEM